MSNVLLFVPQRELDTEKNLIEFISFCRTKLSVFGDVSNFDDMVWDVSQTASRKGQGTKRERVTFCTQHTVGQPFPAPLPDVFQAFAKAYILQQQLLKPVVNQGVRVAVLRALHMALSEHGTDRSVIHADFGIFNRAAQILAARFSEAAAYRHGSQLELLAGFMADTGLLIVPVKWFNPLSRPLEGTRVGHEYDEERSEKMPSPEALDALPRAYRLATEPSHVIVTSIAAILCSAPDRINELLHLPLECEVVEHQKELDADAYGLRWWPSKGALPMVKWIIPSMSSVVREALVRIRDCTAKAREIAAWYEENPNKLYLSSENKHYRRAEWLTMQEVGEILWRGRCARTGPLQWCKDNKIDLSKNGRLMLASFKAIEQRILSMLPAGFPLYENERGMKYSEALCVVQRNQFHKNKATYNCLIEPIVIQHVNDGLGARSEHGSESIFDAYDLKEADGTPICITSHQFRHYLNTLAQIGGMGQLDIAKWSGRKDIRQNVAYDHTSTKEFVEKIRDIALQDVKVIGPLASLPKNIPVTRDEFFQLKIPTAHTTELGFCIHDYTMSPCQMYRDCINCEELVCVKGDKAKLENLRLRLEESKMLLVKAEEAQRDGYLGGDRWMEHHSMTTSRLTQLYEIFSDPKIPEGSVIQLSNISTPSLISELIEDRLLSTGSDVGVEEIDADEDMSNVLMREMMKFMQ